MQISDTFRPRVNVRISHFNVAEDGTRTLLETRESHNIMTNTGRAWFVRQLGAFSYADMDNPTPLSTAKIGYMGFGCGGALQTKPGFLHTQMEVASVTNLEDAVPIKLVDGDPVWLKRVQDMTDDLVHFPGGAAGSAAVFVTNLLSTEISFAASRTWGSGKLVGTNVPVSEAMLFLTSADPSLPVQSGKGVCYNVFSPIPVTPSSVLRAEWSISL